MNKNFPTKAHNHLFRHEQWNIGIVHEPITALLERNSPIHIDWLPLLKKDGYLADPFAISFHGRRYALCEEFDYRSSKGRIASIEFDEDLVPSEPVSSLEFPFHASYPYSFELDDRIYCVPETADGREISLYEAIEFPSRWTKVRTLVDGFAGCDPTLFRHQDKWWLSATGEVGEDRLSKLFVWYAASLLGPWRPHEKNPVKTGFRSSRPGGTPFTHKGELYRPAQDCSDSYGSQIIINRVSSLTEDEFTEQEVATIKPDSTYPSGLHTVTQAGDITFVDGRRIAFNKVAFRHALISAPSEFSRFLSRCARLPEASK